MNPERAGRLARALCQKLPREMRAQIEQGRLAGDGRRDHRPRDGPRARRRRDLRRAPERHFRVAPRLRRSTRANRSCWSRTSSPPASPAREAIKAIAGAGGEVLAAAALVDRIGGEVDLGVPFFPLVEINFPTYPADELPPELAAIPVEQARQPQGCLTWHDAPPRRQHRPRRDDPQRARRRSSRSGARGRDRRPARRRRHHRAFARRPAAHPRRRLAAHPGGDRPAAQPRDGGDRRDARDRPRATGRTPRASCPRSARSARPKAGSMPRGSTTTSQPIVSRLRDAGIRVSLFIGPEERQVDAALRLGVPVVEFHTGEYAHAEGEQVAAELQAHRRHGRARRQERHRAACRPRPDLRQRPADRRDSRNWPSSTSATS